MMKHLEYKKNTLPLQKKYIVYMTQGPSAHDQLERVDRFYKKGLHRSEGPDSLYDDCCYSA